VTHIDAGGFCPDVVNNHFFCFLDVYVHALFVFGPDVLGLSAKTAIR